MKLFLFLKLGIEVVIVLNIILID